jgi:hypothetical protein
VKTLSSSCFLWCLRLENVIFEFGSNLELIDSQAFASCPNLRSVQLPAPLSFIHGSAFFGCRFDTISVAGGNKCLETTQNALLLSHGIRVVRDFGHNSLIEIGAAIEVLEEGCFTGSLIDTVMFASRPRLSVIRTGAFQFSTVRVICIPSGVLEIGDGCFSDCSVLELVEFEQNSCLKQWSHHLFSQSGLKSIVVPRSVEVIAYRCCSGCKRLRTVVFENGSRLQEIGRCAFHSSGLGEICIPRNTESIGSFAFCGCYGLTKITFESDSRIKTIEESAFARSGIGCITFPRSLERISGLAFHEWRSVFVNTRDSHFRFEGGFLVDREKGLIRYVDNAQCLLISPAVKVIAPAAFSMDRVVQTVRFAPGCTLCVLSQQAFSQSSIQDIVIPRTVRIIGQECFRGCPDLRSVVFEYRSNLKRIDDRALAESGLPKVAIPESVESIGARCFFGCYALADVSIPVSSRLREVGLMAFFSCRLTAVALPSRVDFAGCFDRECEVTVFTAETPAICPKCSVV